MDRRSWLAAAVAGLAVPFSVAAQRGKVRRVGFLAARHVDSLHSDPVFAAFPRAMRELGYEEGRDLVIELRFVEGDSRRLDALAMELVALPVDVIVTMGANATRAAQKASNAVPIVMGTAGDPVGSGFVKSLARPGGNITGLSDVASDMGAKLLDILMTLVPGMAHAGVMLNSANPSHRSFVASMREAARLNGVSLQELHAAGEREIDDAFAAMAKQRIQGAIALPDPVFNPRQRQIAALAAKHRIPCISGFRPYVRAGGLITYGPDLSDNVRRAATYVDRILKGARPSDLPVEQPTRFELGVNLKAAQALGIAIPASLLVRADEVVQ